MKVISLNTYDLFGGAAIAAYRLHKGLRNSGVDSQMLVQSRSSDDTSVITPTFRFEKSLALLRPKIDLLPLKFYPHRSKNIFSQAFLPERLAKRILSKKPDIIHLHWICHGLIKIETLQKISKPIIWTLHDSWAFTGGCHIPLDCKKYQMRCGSCPALGSEKEDDLSHRILERKRKAWKNLDLTIVTPSKWLAKCADSSSLFNDKKIKTIPNGLDTNIFKPIDKNMARNIFNLPQDKKLILFGATGGIPDRNKGFHFLPPTMKILLERGWKGKCILIVFGATKPENSADFDIDTYYVGKLSDEISLAVLYSSADVFVLPSIQENLPNTVMEALACGTPCVAFNVGGIPDLIEHERNGYLAKPFDTDDLAKGIEWVLENDDRWRVLSQRARLKVEEEFGLDFIANRYIELYKEILK